MTGLSMLWLPILLSAVFVFVASSIIHMLTPWHKNDYPKYKDEANVLDTLRPLNIPPGDYMMPIASSTKELASPEFTEKVKKGPVVVMTVLPNEPSPMGRNLALWFVYSLIVSIFAAYIAGRALPHGAYYLQVFRFAGATAFIGYSLALMQMSIWYRRSWRITIKSMIDGLVYGLLTAGVFGWLWPKM